MTGMPEISGYPIPNDFQNRTGSGIGKHVVQWVGIGYPLFSGEGEHTFISKDMDSWIDVEVLIKFDYFARSFFVRRNLLKMQRTQQTLAL